MNATAVAGGDEDVRQMCATVAQGAVPARAAMVCTTVANCCSVCAGCCRTVCINRGKTSRQVETWSQTVWSASAAVRRVLCEDARQMHTAVLDRVHSADPTSDRRTLPEFARERTLYLIPECDMEEDVIRCWSICPTNH